MQLIEAVKNLLPTLGTNDKFRENRSRSLKRLFLFLKFHKINNLQFSTLPFKIFLLYILTVVCIPFIVFI